jgi:hypothetical protein
MRVQTSNSPTSLVGTDGIWDMSAMYFVIVVLMRASMDIEWGGETRPRPNLAPGIAYAELDALAAAPRR